MHTVDGRHGQKSLHALLVRPEMEPAHGEYCAPMSSPLVVVPNVDALTVRRRVELALVSGLAALGGGKAGSATLLPLENARTGVWLLLALRVRTVDLLALVSVSAAKGSCPGFATALVVLSDARSADSSCSGQNDSHGGRERNELHPVPVALFRLL
jgi:hypothetical protein